MDDQVIKPKQTFSWVILYIVLLIFGQQLAGIGGAMGGAFIAFGLNKVIQNQNYSINKKFLYSILYIIGGIVMALIIITGISFVLRYYFPTIGQKSNIEATYQIPPNFSDYKNENMGISSFAYPIGWNVKEGKKDEYAVNFQAPDRVANVTANLLVLDVGQTLDYKTFTTNLVEQAKTETSISFQKTEEAVKTINGKDWLIYNSMVGVKSTNSTYYNRTALFVTGKNNDRQYFQFLLESDGNHFAEDSKIFDKMIESLRFYQ